MKDLRALDQYRCRDHETLALFGWAGDGACGAFIVPSPIDGQPLRVIASSECGWDHISVSRSTRCPNWPEMARIKSLFFEPTEIAIEYHVPADQHINDHPYCLHLWRPQRFEIPLPPSWMVGGCSLDEAMKKAREFAA